MASKPNCIEWIECEQQETRKAENIITTLYNNITTNRNSLCLAKNIHGVRPYASGSGCWQNSTVPYLSAFKFYLFMPKWSSGYHYYSIIKIKIWKLIQNSKAIIQLLDSKDNEKIMTRMNWRTNYTMGKWRDNKNNVAEATRARLSVFNNKN